MKKILVFVFASVLGFVNVSAEDYGIKVGGVSVTSSNCNNVTGSNIKAYKEGESYYVKYNFSTKTLTLKNVKIERTGSDNRAIYNTGCDGLTIVLDGSAYLSAKDASAVRLEKNTTIKCKNIERIGLFQILGDQENAIYLTNGATLVFDSAAVIISGGSNSSAIEGKNATEKIVVMNSSLYVGIDYGNEYYALRNIGSLQVQASAMRLSANTGQSTVKNLKAFSLASGTYLLTTMYTDYEEIEHNPTKGTFVWKSSGEEFKKSVMISKAVPVDKAHFPDDAFRNHVLSKISGYGYFGSYIIPNYPLGAVGENSATPLYIFDNTKQITDLSLSGKGITSLQGIEYLPHVQSINCSNNSLTSLDLSKNLQLQTLNCSNNDISSLKLPVIVQATSYSLLSTINCSNCKLTSLDLSYCSLNLAEVNCSNNLLTSLTLPSSAEKLSKLKCENNRLSSLKMPTNIENLTTLSCYGNRIKGNGTWEFVRSLHNASTERMVYFVDHTNANEQNECTAEQCYMAKSGKWLLCHNYNGGWRTTTACPHPHTIYYVVDGKVIFYKPDVLTGSIITPAEAPQKEGYTFSRWDGMPTVMPDSNVTVTAVYTLNKYTLTYMIDGETYRSQSVDYGASITPLTVPKREGYTFSGWSEIPATMPAHDVTITASYNVNYYNLTYLIDRSVYKILKVSYGATITPLGSAEDNKYYYAWEDEPTIMPAHDVDVHAVITSIAPLLSGGAGGRPVNVYYDLQGHKVTNPVKGNIYIVNKKKVIYK